MNLGCLNSQWKNSINWKQGLLAKLVLWLILAQLFSVSEIIPSYYQTWMCRWYLEVRGCHFFSVLYFKKSDETSVKELIFEHRLSSKFLLFGNRTQLEEIITLNCSKTFIVQSLTWFWGSNFILGCFQNGLPTSALEGVTHTFFP